MTRHGTIRTECAAGCRIGRRVAKEPCIDPGSGHARSSGLIDDLVHAIPRYRSAGMANNAAPAIAVCDALYQKMAQDEIKPS